MNDDVIIKTDEINFNYRVAIVIRKGKSILLQKDDRAKYLTLPGGRCKLGESSADTGIREMMEETGIKCLYKKNLGIVENFFTSSFVNKRMHEILMLVEHEFKDKKNYDLKIIKNYEKKNDKFKHLIFTW